MIASPMPLDRLPVAAAHADSWLASCQRALDEADAAAVRLAASRTKSATEIAILKLRIETLRADIDAFRASLARRGERIDPEWTGLLSPWCPPTAKSDG